MSRALPLFVIVAWVAAATAGPASGKNLPAEATISCPPEIEADSWRPVKPPQGWVGHMSEPLRLQGGGMMKGGPDSMTYLVPHSVKETRDGMTQVWKFTPGDGERWLYCDYTMTHGLQLYRRLDDSVLECQSRSVGNLRLKSLSFQCK